MSHSTANTSHDQTRSGSTETVFRFLAQPVSVNYGGKVHGGALMKWIDEAGYACATAWSGSYCVTVSVGNILFQRPIQVGDIVELHARVVATGRTSIHIYVSVHAGDPKSGKLSQTTECMIVFVAVDEAGQPSPVPSFVPRTEEERALTKYAGDVRVALGAINHLRPQYQQSSAS